MGNYENIYVGDIRVFFVNGTKYNRTNIIDGPKAIVKKGAVLVKIDEDTFADIDTFKIKVVGGVVTMICDPENYLKTEISDPNFCHYVDPESLVSLQGMIDAKTLKAKEDLGVGRTFTITEN